MGKAMWKPPKGTMVWFVHESFYRRPGAVKYQPEYEFMVFEGEVMSYRVGSWTSVLLKYRERENGPIELADVKLDAGKPTIFDNPRDAALSAKAQTEDYLRRWGWAWNPELWPDKPPMPRRWEKYLEDGD